MQLTMSKPALLTLAASIPFLLFGTPSLGASLSFTPAEDVIDYGDVLIGQMANKPVLKILATDGDCSGTIRPDDDPAKPAPAGQQTIAPANFDFASGDQTDIWVGILSTEPGDHDFYIKIESSCGTYHKTIRFHCIGYGYVHGSIKDAASGQSLPSATVKPGNPYLMQVTLLGQGTYSARGYPGSHLLIANSPGYLEQMVTVELQEGDSITHDFQLERKSPIARPLPWLPLLLE